MNNSARVKIFADPTIDTSKIDWTKHNERSKYDLHNEWAKEICDKFGMAGYKVIFMTGRTGEPSTRKITEQWLLDHIGMSYDWELIMRVEGDFRPDDVVKRDLFNQHVGIMYEVMFAVDDRLSICSTFRSMGIPSLHCEDY